MRTEDKKHLCNNLIMLKTPHTLGIHQYLKPMERWCYENIPEDHLWTSEIVNPGPISSSSWSIQKHTTMNRFWFEHKADAMWFKLVWQP